MIPEDMYNLFSKAIRDTFQVCLEKDKYMLKLDNVMFYKRLISNIMYLYHILYNNTSKTNYYTYNTSNSKYH